jgi:metal-dependent hydrolase (beta-lactamase superfamily II)
MKFTALPVNVGDSFYLEDEGKNILVDGGLSSKLISGEQSQNSKYL